MTGPAPVRYDIADSVRFYASPELRPSLHLGDEEYARARASIATWCLDGLACARDTDGQPAVVLLVRRNDGPGSGPFRNEPWVIGGKWDMVTPWKTFVQRKVAQELFGGVLPGAVSIEGPLGNQLFATGWGAGPDGPFGYHGVTIQYCYKVVLAESIALRELRPDRDHSRYLLLRPGDDLSALHPYIRDVVVLSEWLAGPA